MTSRAAVRRASLGNTYLLVALCTLLALVVWLYRLAGPVLDWDEGRSLAHRSLPWTGLWQVATEEWHPPAYVALLRLWLIAGRGAWSTRYLSVLPGVLAVPLAHQVARAWSSRGRVGVLAAAFAACWPLLVYHGRVTRMYALSALAVLAAAWFTLRSPHTDSWRDGFGLVGSSVVGLYDPESRERLRLLDGGDAVQVCVIPVQELA